MNILKNKNKCYLLNEFYDKMLSDKWATLFLHETGKIMCQTPELRINSTHFKDFTCQEKNNNDQEIQIFLF